MVAHPKVKKTIKKGLRSSSEDGIIPALRESAQKMKGWVERLLADNSQFLTEEDTYVLFRVKKAAERLVSTTESDKQELLTELNRLEEQGYRLKFSSDDIWGMNAAAILIRKEGKLTGFVDRAEKKLKGAK